MARSAESLSAGAQCGLGPLPRSLLKSAASTAWRVPARMPPRSAAAGASNSARVRLTMPSALVFACGTEHRAGFRRLSWLSGERVPAQRQRLGVQRLVVAAGLLQLLPGPGSGSLELFSGCRRPVLPVQAVAGRTCSCHWSWGLLQWCSLLEGWGCTRGVSAGDFPELPA
jgi:hypothetical protein